MEVTGGVTSDDPVWSGPGATGCGGVASKRGQEGVSLQVPNFQCVVLGRRDSAPPVRRNRHAPDKIRVAFQSAEITAAFQVPHLERLISRSGNGPPAIRSHRHTINTSRVAFESTHFAGRRPDPTASSFCHRMQKPPTSHPPSPPHARQERSGLAVCAVPGRFPDPTP